MPAIQSKIPRATPAHQDSASQFSTYGVNAADAGKKNSQIFNALAVRRSREAGSRRNRIFDSVSSRMQALDIVRKLVARPNQQFQKVL